MAQRRASERGTSLIEVLTTTGVMALLLAIGVPNLVRLRQPYAARSAASQIAADLQAARLRAIARNTQVRVRFADDGSGYLVERLTAGNWVDDSGFRALPKSADLDDVSPNDPVFDSRGMLPAQVTITVSAQYAQPKTVTVNVLGHTTID